MDAVLFALRQAGLPNPEIDFDLVPGQVMDESGAIRPEPSSMILPLAWPGYRIGAVGSDHPDLPRLINACHFFNWKLFVLPVDDVEASLGWLGKALSWGQAHFV